MYWIDMVVYIIILFLLEYMFHETWNSVCLCVCVWCVFVYVCVHMYMCAFWELSLEFLEIYWHFVGTQ